MRTPRSTPANGSPGPDPAGPGSRTYRPGAPVPPRVRGRRAHAGPPADESPDTPRERPPWDRTHLPPFAPDTSAPDTATGGAPRNARSGGAGQGGGTARDGRRPGPRLRARSVRAKVICVLMVPVVSLIALWGYATVTTAQDVARLRQMERVNTQLRVPLEATVAALQDERAAAARYLARPSRGHRAALDRDAAATDRGAGRLRLGSGHTVAEGADLPDGVTRRLEGFVRRVDDLRVLRQRLGSGVDWPQAYRQYTDTVERAFGVGGALTGVQDAGGASQARVLLEFGRAGELFSREDALLTAGQLTRSLPAAQQREFIGAAHSRRLLQASSAADFAEGDRASWRKATRSAAYRGMTSLEDRVAAAAPGRAAATAVSPSDWDAVSGDVLDAYRTVQRGAQDEASRHVDPVAAGLLTPGGAAVALGLVAVAAALVISVRIGRGLVIELVDLRNSALELARRKLPDAMRRLRAGQELDIVREAPSGDPGDDEIAQVGEALNVVHRAALQAAAERAELASGISGVFVNLARRSQVLVHRQLTLLDSMERRADDPGELEDLFRLDHLTTRMRRHAESLIILSGSAPGRAWRMPVPLQNVVRAAVSEVEDYARVEVRALPDTAVVGAAVADLTHLLAELVENAAQFSPPHTKVRVYGEQVGNGYAIEIEDRGLGMSKESLEAANRRIQQSEALDLFDSDRLGLFVVSRLAARHRIQVNLRDSPYGGTTVVVLLPKALLQPVAPLEGRPGKGPRTREEPAQNGTTAERVRERALAAPSKPAGEELPALTAQRPREAGESRPDVVQLRLRDATLPGQPAPDPESERAGDVPEGPPGDEADLPRRVRQASLAPQLRDGTGEGEPEDGPQEPGRSKRTAAEPPRDRTPEEARARMAAYRSGWVRGGGLTVGRAESDCGDAGESAVRGAERRERGRTRGGIRGEERRDEGEERASDGRGATRSEGDER